MHLHAFACNVKAYFLKKNKKYISKCHQLKFAPSMQSSNCIKSHFTDRNFLANMPSLSMSFYSFYGERRKIIITKTCLYNFDSLKPHFYIEKLGFTGVNIIFLISAQNKNCGYSLEPPHREERRKIIITKTCLYNFDSLRPHFYIVKLGFTGVNIIFLISAQNIDCGYLLESPG